MNSMIRNTLTGAIAAVCLGTVLPASAEEPPPSITVNFADLNINSPAGAEVLYRRIQKAAKKVCSYDDDAALPGILRICFEKSVANAVSKVKSAPLHAVHSRKSGAALQG